MCMAWHRTLPFDATHASGNPAEGPLPLGPDVLGGDLSTCPAEVDLLIVGAGLSGRRVGTLPSPRYFASQTTSVDDTQ
jgi:hypothetical protein